jgi:formate hydrogenlyase transcriptional activator
MAKGASRPTSQNLLQAIASRFETLMAVSLVVGSHRDIEGLFSALALELVRVIDFDFIAIMRYDVATRNVLWHLSMPDGSLERGTIDETKEESVCEWMLRRQKSLNVPFPGGAACLQGNFNELANDGMQPLCEFPLNVAHRRIGSFLICRKRPGCYIEEEVRFLSLIADMIALSVGDAINSQALHNAQVELQNEKDKVSLLLELNNHVVSNRELQKTLEAASASVRRVMRCDVVAVHLPDRKTNKLQPFALDPPTADGVSKEDALLSNDGCRWRCTCEVYKTGKPTLIEQASSESCCSSANCVFCKASSGQTIRSICALPLISRDRVLGVLELVRRRDPAFSPADSDFMCKAAGQIAIAIENALVNQQIADLEGQLARESLCLEDEIRSERGFEEIIGRSAAIRAVLRKVETVAPTNSTVLIYGETGTGKELIARAIHERSLRNSSPFVQMNCAAIPTGLLESELFGHERGAFTGAIVQRIGRFELANHGTAFLDEIGEVALELQPKLLRVLQEREFERLGSPRTLKTDARLIAATNRDLAACVEEKSFRADLYYRLNVFPIHVPPLRDRPEDIPLLVRHFAQMYARRIGRSIDTIPTEAMEALVKHSWPGNIRELQNLIEHSVILSSGPVLRVPLASLQSANIPKPDGLKHRTLEEAERDFILATLKDTKGKLSGPGGAAERLGLKRTTLQRKMQILRIMNVKGGVRGVHPEMR